MFRPLHIGSAWMLFFICLVAGCSPGPSKPVAPQESFRQLVSEVKERAATKTSDRLAIVVTEQLATGRQTAEAGAGTIQVRKQTPGGVPGNEKKTAEVIDIQFVHENGRWRCSKAVSKDFEGDKEVGQNSLAGPDIQLTNLFLWMRL